MSKITFVFVSHVKNNIRVVFHMSTITFVSVDFVDKDGTVTVAQLEKIFHHHGLEADAKSVFAFADRDVNGSVSMQDYLDWQEKHWQAQKLSESSEEVATEFDSDKTTEENYARKDQVRWWTVPPAPPHALARCLPLDLHTHCSPPGCPRSLCTPWVSESLSIMP